MIFFHVCYNQRVCCYYKLCLECAHVTFLCRVMESSYTDSILLEHFSHIMSLDLYVIFIAQGENVDGLCLAVASCKIAEQGVRDSRSEMGTSRQKVM